MLIIRWCTLYRLRSFFLIFITTGPSSISNKSAVALLCQFILWLFDLHSGTHRGFLKKQSGIRFFHVPLWLRGVLGSRSPRIKESSDPRTVKDLHCFKRREVQQIPPLAENVQVHRCRQAEKTSTFGDLYKPFILGSNTLFVALYPSGKKGVVNTEHPTWWVLQAYGIGIWYLIKIHDRLNPIITALLSLRFTN